MSNASFLNPVKGYTCASCEYYNAFPAYVFAHWRDVLDTECEQCQCPYTVICGHAALKTTGPTAKTVRWFTAFLAEYNRSVQ